MTYFAYLDEFGHIGPYVSKQDPKHNDSPVFGLAGFVLPAEEVRGFGTWFFQRKCELLAFEIKRSDKHPAQWEKKGSALYTVPNVTCYPELRVFTNRLLNKIGRLGGFVFYVGIKKTRPPADHNPNQLYLRVFLEAIAVGFRKSLTLKRWRPARKDPAEFNVDGLRATPTGNAPPRCWYPARAS